MNEASSDDTHDVTPSLHEIKPWPCPHCRYDLRSTVDSWKEESVTCPECGESCTAIESSNTLYLAAPSGWIWKTLSWLPACLYCLFVIIMEYTNQVPASLILAVFFCVFVAPIVWLFGLSMYRYRYAWSLSTRLLNSFIMMIGLQIANVIAALALGICAGLVVELFKYLV